MTSKGPTSLEWLTPDRAKEFGVHWAALQPPRALPVPPQPKLQRSLQPPPQVIVAWSTEVWKRLIVDRLEQLKVYPPDARERKEAGVVQVTFSLNRKGELVSSRMAASSGYPSLDVASLEIIRKGQPFAPPPTHIKGEEITFSVPIRFSLQEATGLDANNVFAHINRGLAWHKKGEFDKAIADLDEAIRLNPKYVFTYAAAWHGAPRANSKRPSPTLTRRSGSIRNLIGPISIAA